MVKPDQKTNENTSPTPQNTPQKKRDLISQSIIPHTSLKRAVDVAKAICDNYGSNETPPHELAKAVGYSPTSYSWRLLSGAAVAYGLTKGAYNSHGISVTDLGIAICMPSEPGQRERALVEAALKPKILNDFFNRYNRQKFPLKEYAISALKTIMKVPPDRAEKTYEIIKENGEYVGIITDTKGGGQFVSIEVYSLSPKKENGVLDTTEPPQTELSDEPAESEGDIEKFAASLTKKFEQTPTQVPLTSPESPKSNRVFVSHGKNKLIVDQLKEIIRYGKYEPIISVERESTSKPVPEKVLDDMRSCFAGVILINVENELIDKDGHVHKKINDNVLIEIGAALALYRHNNILLVQRGVELPSNLQGLYRCEYEGDTLDMEATIKLLKGFNEFK